MDFHEDDEYVNKNLNGIDGLRLGPHQNISGSTVASNGNMAIKKPVESEQIRTEQKETGKGVASPRQDK